MGHVLAGPGDRLGFELTIRQYPKVRHFYLWGSDSSNAGVQYVVPVHQLELDARPRGRRNAPGANKVLKAS